MTETMIGLLSDKDWFVCDGSRRCSLAEMLSLMPRGRDTRIAGQGAGVWQAVSLAAHCDARLLLLMGEPSCRNFAARAARAGAYAVVCPVVLYTQKPRAFPEFTNAPVYWVKKADALSELLFRLDNKNDL